MLSEPQLDLSAEQRLCIFLSLLDEDAAAQMLDGMPEQRRESLREGVERLEGAPPTVAEAEAVVDEFERIFRLLGAVDASSPGQVAADAEPDPSDQAEQAANAGSSSKTGLLEEIEPRRLAAAVREELPQTVAVVARQLSADRAGEMLAKLPADLRSTVLVRLNEPVLPSPRLVEQVLQATLQRALEIDPRDIQDELPGEQKMAQVLRAMSRKDRTETLTSLGEENPELAQAVQSNLFEFEDMIRMDDRSIKMLLGEVESDSLSLALKDAPEEFLAKVVRNLSRRAGEALAEEVEFMPPPNEEEQAAARARVVQLISKLDQEGALKMS